MGHYNGTEAAVSATAFSLEFQYSLTWTLSDSDLS